MDGAEAKGGMRRHAAEEVWLVGLTAHVHFHSSTVTITRLSVSPYLLSFFVPPISPVFFLIDL